MDNGVELFRKIRNEQAEQASKYGRAFLKKSPTTLKNRLKPDLYP